MIVVGSGIEKVVVHGTAVGLWSGEERGGSVKSFGDYFKVV